LTVAIGALHLMLARGGRTPLFIVHPFTSRAPFEGITSRFSVY
jgi:hypothetical protein